MEEIKMYAGQDVDDAYRQMKAYRKATGQECFVKFNDKVLYWYESRNACYLKVTGISRKNYLKLCSEEVRKYKRRERKHKARLPKLIKEYKAMARGVIEEKYLEQWDRCVPIRLADIYRGFDLECTLELIKVLNEDLPENERFEACRLMMEEQSHSGWSAAIVRSGLSLFHKDGNSFIEYLKESGN